MLEKQGVEIDKVLNFAIDDSILEERITGRWIHPSSGRSYHTKFAPPKVPGVDDVSWCHFSPIKLCIDDWNANLMLLILQTMSIQVHLHIVLKV